jgi:hypothetical protein
VTLDEARADLEAMFLSGPSTKCYKAMTGEHYVEVVSGGVKEEGERYPILCATPELAVSYWFTAAVEYAMNVSMDYYLTQNDPIFDHDRYKRHGFTLYWRIVPELDEVTLVLADCPVREKVWMQRKFWYVYSRFLVSKKPQTQQAMSA